MNHSEFIITMAIALFLAFCLGWCAHWVINKFTRVSQGDMGELDQMAQSLHDAEEMRDQAIAYVEAKEAELNSRVTETDAELRAAMDALRDARAEADDLREYIEALNQPD